MNHTTLTRAWMDVSGSLPRPNIKQVTDETMRLAMRLAGRGIKQIPNDEARDMLAYPLDFVHGHVLSHQNYDEDTCNAVSDALAESATTASVIVHFIKWTVPEYLTKKALDVASERTWLYTDQAVPSLVQRNLDRTLSWYAERGSYAVPMAWIDLDVDDDPEMLALLEAMARVSLEAMRDLAEEAAADLYDMDKFSAFYEALDEAARLGLLWA